MQYSSLPNYFIHFAIIYAHLVYGTCVVGLHIYYLFLI